MTGIVQKCDAGRRPKVEHNRPTCARARASHFPRFNRCDRLTRQFPFDGMKKLRWVQAGRQVDKQTDRQTGKQVVGDGDDDNDRGLGLDDDYGGGHINRHYLWHYF